MLPRLVSFIARGSGTGVFHGLMSLTVATGPAHQVQAQAAAGIHVHGARGGFDESDRRLRDLDAMKPLASTRQWARWIRWMQLRRFLIGGGIRRPRRSIRHYWVLDIMMGHHDWKP